MEKELCPMCKSPRTDFHTSGSYMGRWVCDNQGCSGKIGGDKYFWNPGQGLPVEKKKEEKPERLK